MIENHLYTELQRYMLLENDAIDVDVTAELFQQTPESLAPVLIDLSAQISVSVNDLQDVAEVSQRFRGIIDLYITRTESRSENRESLYAQLFKHMLHTDDEGTHPLDKSTALSLSFPVSYQWSYLYAHKKEFTQHNYQMRLNILLCSLSLSEQFETPDAHAFDAQTQTEEYEGVLKNSRVLIENKRMLARLLTFATPEVKKLQIATLLYAVESRSSDLSQRAHEIRNVCADYLYTKRNETTLPILKEIPMSDDSFWQALRETGTLNLSQAWLKILVEKYIKTPQSDYTDSQHDTYVAVLEGLLFPNFGPVERYKDHYEHAVDRIKRILPEQEYTELFMQLCEYLQTSQSMEQTKHTELLLDRMVSHKFLPYHAVSNKPDALIQFLKANRNRSY